MEKELARIDKLIESYTEFHRQYPRAGFDETIHMLRCERMQVTDRIGRNNERKTSKANG